MRRMCLIAGLIVGMVSTSFTGYAQEATPEVDDISYALEWSVKPPTEEQVAEARDCNLEALSAERYPDTLSIDELAEAYRPQSACDWAVLAVAYANLAENDGIELPEAGKAAFVEAVLGNPALAFASLMFFGYYNAVPLVEPPPLAGQAITEVVIDYRWIGMGGQVNYRVTISEANREPIISGNLNIEPFSYGAPEGTRTPAPTHNSVTGSVQVDLVQALGPALSDLLPIARQFQSQPCWDNYPDWTVSLTFEDGTQMAMVTNNSNWIGVGGPWQTNLDGQDYMQYSSAFVLVLLEITDELELPSGQPMAMGCGGDYSLLEAAFPADR